MADVKRKYNVETTLTAQKVCQLIDDGKINDLPLIVKHDAVLANSFTNGALYQLNSINSASINAIAIDETHVAVFYIYSAYAYSVVLTIAGDVISAGTPVQHVSTSPDHLTAEKLDSTHIVLSYRAGSDSYYNYAIVIAISGTTLSAGTAVKVTSNTWEKDMVRLDDTHILIVYTYVNAVVLTISGTSISIGTMTLIYNDSAATGFSIAALSATKAIVTFTNYGSASGHPMAIVVTISGTTITAGTMCVLNNSQYINYNDVVAIDSSRAIMFYQYNDGTSNFYMWGIVMTISGTTITPGTATQITSLVSGACIQAELVDSSHVFVSYSKEGTAYLYGLTVEITGSIIVVGTVSQIASTGPASMEPVLFSPRKMLLAYRNGSTYYLWASVITTPIATPAETRNGKVIGVSIDPSGNVQLKGKCKILSGLTPGSKYYFDANGVISTTNTGTFLGVALSATELLIPDYLIS